MKQLNRLREEFGEKKKTQTQPVKRTAEIVQEELAQARDQGKFYSFCLLQIEYKCFTGHYWKV